MPRTLDRLIVGIGLIVGLGLWAALAAPAVAGPPHPSAVPAEETRMPAVELNHLESLGAFPVTLAGEIQEAFPDHRPCLYSEALYGDYHDGAWASWTMIGHTGVPLVAHTPKGIVSLRSSQMRLHLAPSYWHVFHASDAASAPEVIRPELRPETGPITVAAYDLVTGRTYYGKVDRIGYWLPPRPGTTKPERHYTQVLVLSDQPFVDGKPPGPLTPYSGSLTF